MSLRDAMRDRVYETNIRADEIRANSLFKVGKNSGGGEQHLIQIGDGIIRSSRFGGVVGVGDTVLIRNDSGQSFFY